METIKPLVENWGKNGWFFFWKCRWEWNGGSSCCISMHALHCMHCLRSLKKKDFSLSFSLSLSTHVWRHCLATRERERETLRAVFARFFCAGGGGGGGQKKKGFGCQQQHQQQQQKMRIKFQPELSRLSSKDIKIYKF